MGNFQQIFFFKKRSENFKGLQCLSPVFRQRNIIGKTFLYEKLIPTSSASNSFNEVVSVSKQTTFCCRRLATNFF